jgi:hypothetical protein
MRTLRRIRNVAFLGLLVAVSWSEQATLSAAGGYFCAYGICEVTWTGCSGTWNKWDYPDQDAPDCLGCCTIKYTPGGSGNCDIEYDPQETTQGYKMDYDEQGGNHFWTCRQDPMPE